LNHLNRLNDLNHLNRDLRLVIDPADQGIGRLIRRGSYELNEQDFVDRTVSAGQVVIDVGAHVGLYTMQLAALVGPTGCVYAFEPCRESAECLDRGIRANQFDDRVRVACVAVAASHGSQQLIVAPRDPGAAFLQMTKEPAPEGSDVRTVEVIALDAFPLRRPVSFLRMDVEGAEGLVLAGAMRLLAEDRPIVLVELHLNRLVAVSGSTVAALLERMRGIGYRCHLLGAGAPGEAVVDIHASGVTSVVFLPELRVERDHDDPCKS
jgi:FkbM family methyltransferase